jgi:DNA-binding NarL/FixJ family response regulator
MSPHDIGSAFAATAMKAEGAASAGGGKPGRSLTDREHEVAVLVTAGLTNRAIGEQLFISEATVARHIANIFGKLGLTSRAQVAVWVAGQDGAA